MNVTNLRIASDNNKEIYVAHYGRIVAGFPKPSEDYTYDEISLDKKYLYKKHTTYIATADGNSMEPTIYDKDELIIRTDLPVLNNSIIIASINGEEYTCKRIDLEKKILIADNKKFKAIEIDKIENFIILGVVKHIIRSL